MNHLYEQKQIKDQSLNGYYNKYLYSLDDYDKLNQ